MFRLLSEYTTVYHRSEEKAIYFNQCIMITLCLKSGKPFVNTSAGKHCLDETNSKTLLDNQYLEKHNVNLIEKVHNANKSPLVSFFYIHLNK